MPTEKAGYWRRCTGYAAGSLRKAAYLPLPNLFAQLYDIWVLSTLYTRTFTAYRPASRHPSAQSLHYANGLGVHLRSAAPEAPDGIPRLCGLTPRRDRQSVQSKRLHAHCTRCTLARVGTASRFQGLCRVAPSRRIHAASSGKSGVLPMRPRPTGDDCRPPRRVHAVTFDAS